MEKITHCKAHGYMKSAVQLIKCPKCGGTVRQVRFIPHIVVHKGKVVKLK